MEGKNILVVAVLVIVIAVAAFVVVKRAKTSDTQMPAALLDEPRDVIDVKANQPATITYREQLYGTRDSATGYYKNPSTGAFTYASTMKCASCGKTIPVPSSPLVASNSSNPQAPKMMPDEEKMKAAMAGYVCPLCSKKACNVPETPPPPPPH